MEGPWKPTRKPRTRAGRPCEAHHQGASLGVTVESGNLASATAAMP